MAEVIELSHQDLRWSFDNTGQPSVVIKGGTYPRSHAVDPWPCYAQDAALITEVADRVMACWPVPFPLKWYTVAYETVTRTNGLFQIDPEYAESHREVVRWHGSIVLWGKRIPVHPAMTRYLVAHEYGHAVEDALNLKLGKNPGSSEEGILIEYRKLRGLGEEARSGGCTWHLNLEDIFANDCRILVTGIEPEFWPHPGIARPEEVPIIIDWWHKLKLDN